MQEFKALANSLADEAGKIVKKYYRTPFDINSKSDNSPVTIADREIEKTLRAMIEARYPDHGILGEEFGTKDSQSGYTWVIDPIDGTKAFATGRPTFGTLIALCKDDVPILGVIDQAIMGERWIGVEGEETTWNGQQVKTRRCASIKNAGAAATTPLMFDGKREGLVEDLNKGVSFIQWGGDCYAYGLLASGFIDVVLEAELQPYDFAALVPIVNGAGGQITDWHGKPLTLKSNGDIVALGDKALWPQVEALIAG